MQTKSDLDRPPLSDVVIQQRNTVMAQILAGSLRRAACRLIAWLNARPLQIAWRLCVYDLHRSNLVLSPLNSLYDSCGIVCFLIEL